VTDAFCEECGDLISAETHVCPPRWQVHIPSWRATISICAATPALAAATAVEQVDADRQALDGPVRVLVRPADATSSADEPFDVRAVATVDYSAKPASDPRPARQQTPSLRRPRS
jgi:hypothetical protein